MMSYASQCPEFFMHFARNCLSYQVPLNLFGNIRSETQNGIEVMNVKDSIVMLVNFARIYALKNQVATPATLDRLKALADKDIISQDTFNDFVFAFNYLWHLRFYNQIICHAELKRVNDELDLSQLSDAQLQNLREVLNHISSFQTKLSYDFLGVSQI